jgi:hypothetical protein
VGFHVELLGERGAHVGDADAEAAEDLDGHGVRHGNDAGEQVFGIGEAGSEFGGDVVARMRSLVTPSS